MQEVAHMPSIGVIIMAILYHAVIVGFNVFVFKRQIRLSQGARPRAAAGKP